MAKYCSVLFKSLFATLGAIIGQSSPSLRLHLGTHDTVFLSPAQERLKINFITLPMLSQSLTSQHRTPLLIIFILTLVRSRESVVGQRSFPGAFPDRRQASPISGGHQGRLPLVVLMMMLFMEHYIKSDSFHSNTCLLGQ